MMVTTTFGPSGDVEVEVRKSTDERRVIAMLHAEDLLNGAGITIQTSFDQLKQLGKDINLAIECWEAKDGDH